MRERTFSTKTLKPSVAHFTNSSFTACSQLRVCGRVMRLALLNSGIASMCKFSSRLRKVSSFRSVLARSHMASNNSKQSRGSNTKSSGKPLSFTRRCVRQANGWIRIDCDVSCLYQRNGLVQHLLEVGVEWAYLGSQTESRCKGSLLTPGKNAYFSKSE